MLSASANSAAWLRQQGRDQLTAGVGDSSARWPFFVGCAMQNLVDAIHFLGRVEGSLTFKRHELSTMIKASARGHACAVWLDDGQRSAARIDLLAAEICDACQKLDREIGG